VAIGVGPFLFSVVLNAFVLKACRMSTAYLLARPQKSAIPEISARDSTIRGTSQNAAFVLGAALLRTEVLRLAIGVHR
jgi:hypothetical protein